MQIENRFTVPLAPDQAFAALLDVPRVARCVPGAQLVSSDGDVHSGKMSARLGPVGLTFAGTAEIRDADPQARTAQIVAKGRDQQGRGNAGATTTMAVAPAEDGAEVVLTTDLQLSGPVAQYGRASGAISAVSNAIVSEFARNLRRQLAEDEATASAGEGADGPAADAGAAPSDARPETGPDTGPEPAPAAPAGGGLLWAILKSWVGGLFGRRGG